MVTYVIVATVVSFATAWAWYRYLFPKAAGDAPGGEEAAGALRGRSLFLSAVALVILSTAAGVFISNRGVTGDADLVKLGIKMWFGFFFPIALTSWALTKATVTTLVAHAGFWLAAAIEFALLARWLLLS